MEGRIMSAKDKIKNTSERVSGKVKEVVGSAVGNKDLEAQGQVDQISANLKQAGEKVKDAFRV